MKTKMIAVISALALMLVSSPALTLSQPKLEAAQGRKAWTYLVYLAADNSLDSYADYSLNLMKSGLTPDANVNVIALVDRYNAPATLVQVTSAGITKLADYGEPDMADPATLQSFLTYGIQNYPAAHYAVSAWSHGGGWKYIIIDSSSGNRMSIDGFSKALEAASAVAGKKFDITIFDACLMSLVEVTDQLVNSTDYVLASEESVPGNGFPYDKMLARLMTNPQVDPWVYAQGIADDYYNFYYQSNSKSELSITATKESTLQPLVSAIDTVSLTLLSNMKKYNNAIGGARSVAQHQVWGTNGVFWYVDIKVFFDTLAKKANDATITTQSAAVTQALAATIYERHSGNLNGTINGAGINFPPNYSKYMDKSYLAQNYQGVNLRFTADTHWDEMILASYNNY